MDSPRAPAMDTARPWYRPLPRAARLRRALLVLALTPLLSLADPQGLRYQAGADKPFDEVLDDLKVAISEYNFRLTGENRIGLAIARRGQIPFPRATVLHFCNLEYARRLLQLDPASLAHMPCRVTVYEQAGGVLVGAHLLPLDDPRSRGINREINRILRAIVDEALE